MLTTTRVHNDTRTVVLGNERPGRADKVKMVDISHFFAAGILRQSRYARDPQTRS